MSDTPRKPSLNKLSLKRETASEQPKLEERLHKVLAQAGPLKTRIIEKTQQDAEKLAARVAQQGEQLAAIAAREQQLEKKIAALK